LVQLIANKMPAMKQYLTSRLPPKQLTAQLRVPNIVCHQLDINDWPAVQQLAKKLQGEGVTIDFLVANAAVGYDGGAHMPSPTIAEETLQTNTDSTIHWIKLFLPLLAPNGRVIVVSSEMAALSRQSPRWQKLLNNPALTE
jgi:short-subunit dehydrogenase